MNPFLYTLDNKRYHTLNYFYHQTFHTKVFKISLNGGFTCPNLDGTKGYGGCIYCSKSGSGDFAGNREESIAVQWEKGLTMMKKKWNYKKLLEMLENKKSLFKPLNKDFIKIKCCKFCRTFCRTTKFFKLKHQV